MSPFSGGRADEGFSTWLTRYGWGVLPAVLGCCCAEYVRVVVFDVASSRLPHPKAKITFSGLSLRSACGSVYERQDLIACG